MLLDRLVVSRRAFVVSACAGTLALGSSSALATPTPWADAAFDYVPGLLVDAGYQSTSSIVGSPERFTGEGISPSAVTPFNPAFGTDEILSIGRGGSITLRFDEPVVDDPANPFGIDLLIFGNAGYIDTNFPSGVVGGIFSAGGGLVEVSADGTTWISVTGVADGNFPTLGYADLTDPFATSPGSVLTDFTKPVNPTLLTQGLTFAQLVAAYDGSGGGSGIDLAGSGFTAISYVRISNPAGATQNLQVDALSDVTPIPAPTSLVVAAAAALGAARRRRISHGVVA